MKRSTALFSAGAAVLATAVVTAFGGVSSASPERASAGPLVALGRTGLGNVLVDAHGRTLYLFQKDKRGRSACNDGCAAYWPPLLSSANPRAARGVRASLLGIIKRANGRRQVTYAGHPLYTFTGDTRAGQTTGQGLADFGGTWYVVAANGRAIHRTASDSGGTDGGYGGYGSGR